MSGGAGALESMKVNAGHAATALQVTTQWLRQLAENGVIPKAVKGKYDFLVTLQGYIKWLKDEDRRGMKVSADSSLKAARQRLVELRIAREEGRLVEMEDVETVVSSVFATLRAELTGVPASVTRDTVLRTEIDDAISSAFGRASGKFAKATAKLRSGQKIF